MRVLFDNVDGALKIFSALSDRTRFEILALLLQTGNTGMTAADIARKIEKKIPSTIYQLEILRDANLVDEAMFRVSSINREIKHWYIPPEKRRIIMDFSLPSLNEAANKPLSERLDCIRSYQTKYNIKHPLTVNDVQQIMHEYTLTEEGVFDALAIDAFAQIKYATPPAIQAEIFDEFFNFSPAVGQKVREYLFFNERIMEDVHQGVKVYRVITISLP